MFTAARWPCRIALTTLVTLAAVPPAAAQKTPAAAPKTPAAAPKTPPWSVGVTDAQKATAQRFLEAGNALFLDKKYAAALDQYRAAVEAWDHPAIRFNIVRCLIQLDRPVDASDNLKLALTYGAAPLEEAVYSEALAYEKLLANQIAELAVSCTQPGVAISLDGQPLATCPGQASRRISPGQHQLVGTKAGLLTRTIEVVAIGGTAQAIELTLQPLTKAARIEHRWPTWVPWGVFGGGFAIVGAGGLVRLVAVSQMETYERAVRQRCSDRACDLAQDLGDVRAAKVDAERNGTIAVGLFIAGGATVATGAVLLYLNRGRTVYPSSVEKLVPTVTPLDGGAALTWGGAF